MSVVIQSLGILANNEILILAVSLGGGGNNIVFFAGSSIGVNVEFHGSNGLLFVGDNIQLYTFYGKQHIIVGDSSVCYMDRNTTANGLFIVSGEGKNIILGRDCMLSWDIELWNTDGHFIFDALDDQVLSNGQSVYVGDHIWLARRTTFLKDAFIASGSVIGRDSVAIRGGKFFSNAIYAGKPCKQIKENIFWLVDATSQWNSRINSNPKVHNSDSFKYQFEADKFLNPELIEAQLNSFENPLDKLRFLYDYLYCNTNKNRFALFKDSDFVESKLYCDNIGSFDRLNFLPMQQVRFS